MSDHVFFACLFVVRVTHLPFIVTLIIKTRDLTSDISGRLSVSKFPIVPINMKTAVTYPRIFGIRPTLVIL